MTKRFLLVSVLAAFVAGGAFAQVGLGAGYINSGRNMGAMTGEDRYADKTYDFRDASHGGFLFLDVTYAELSFGLMRGEFAAPGVSTRKSDNSKYGVLAGSLGDVLSVDIGLLGRYPIRVAKITVSPLLGVGYNLVLSAKYRVGDGIRWGKDYLADEAGDYSTMRIMLGAGADFDVTDRIFVRAECTAHYRFAPKAIAKVAERLSDETTGAKYSKSKNGGIGGTYAFAIGYRF